MAAPGGIVLDQWNGDFNSQPDATGRILRKGFDPTNPHLGDAIVATFFWVSSIPTNIIDSVTDVIAATGFPRVGNTYRLVEFIHADSIAMATYVATNVRNFIDASTTHGTILAVEARLSTPVTRAGMIISAWSGVASTFVEALGTEHRSASGTGSPSAPVAGVGPIAVNAGAVAYAASMVTPEAGVDPPAGFGHVRGYLSNGTITGVTDTARVATAGTVHPQWQWGFSGPGTWLASVLSLNPGTAPPSNQPPVADFTSSCSGLGCTFASTSSDPDGSIASYGWTFGDGTPAVTTQNASHTYAAAGTYTVTLTVTDNQGATNARSQSVTVSASANQPPVANFTFSCSGLTCNFTSTSGDPDGTISAYSWSFGDGGTSTAQNPSRTYAAAGSYTVTLRVTDNQGATSAPVARTVGVTPPNQPPVANFTFSCNGLTCSFTSTSSDPDGSIGVHTWTFGDGGTSTAQNPSRSYAAGGSYTVTLRVTDNEGVQSAPTSKTVTVSAPNQPPVANFTFSCSGLTCGFTSTSSDPDGSISAYSWTFGDGGTSTAQNPSRTYAAGGSYSVRLTVTDNRGATNSITKTVTVTAPNSAPVVNAGPDQTALTGLLYSLSWSFSDANNNGPFTYTIDWGDGTTTSGSKTGPGSFSNGHTYITILPRNFTIRVTVRDAAGASSSDTKVVTVLLL